MARAAHNLTSRVAESEQFLVKHTSASTMLLSDTYPHITIITLPGLLEPEPSRPTVKMGRIHHYGILLYLFATLLSGQSSYLGAFTLGLEILPTGILFISETLGCHSIVTTDFSW